MPMVYLQESVKILSTKVMKLSSTKGAKQTPDSTLSHTLAILSRAIKEFGGNAPYPVSNCTIPVAGPCDQCCSFA